MSTSEDPRTAGQQNLPSHEELWDVARQGSSRARDELARLARQVALATLRQRRVAGDDLEDVAQEAVRSTLAFLERGGEAPRNLATFLKFRALGVLSDLRKRMRNQSNTILADPDSHAAISDAPPRAEAELAELRRALTACRSKLSAEQREVLDLRYDRGFDGAAIAESLNLHRNTVHVRVFRALQLLRECLERKGFDPGDLA